jgi:curli biogenesis system outer membrane secretion channel CsgG
MLKGLEMRDHTPRMYFGIFGILMGALLIVCPLVKSAHARSVISDLTVEAEGYGPTLDAAISDALAIAISQVNGVEISSSITSQLREQVSETYGSEQYRLEELLSRDVSKKTAGIVKSFRIISKAQRADLNGVWEVSVSVVVGKLEASKQLKRLRLLISDFTTPSPNKITGSVQHYLQDYLTDFLTQTRKFAILDRKFISQQNKELKFIASGLVATEELAKIGGRVGTDYLVTGTINKANETIRRHKMKLSGRVIETRAIDLNIFLRIIDVSTTQIKYANEFDLSVENLSLDQAVKELSRKASSSILEAIFPLRVVDQVDGKLVIGQGGSLLSISQKFRLTKLGKPVFDTYTGEILGRSEISIGVVEIENVSAKMAIASIVKLDPGYLVNDLLEGLILRPLVSKSKPKAISEISEKKWKKKDEW